MFNPDDFRSLQVTVALKNDTTRTEIRAGARIFGKEVTPAREDEDLSIRLVEFIQQDGIPGVVLDVPPRTCAAGHLVQLLIHVTGPGANSSVIAATRIRDVEALGDGRDRITAMLLQNDPGAWAALTQVFSSRQDDVERLFRKLKDE